MDNQEIIAEALVNLNKFANEQFLTSMGGSHPYRRVYEAKAGRTYTKIIVRDKDVVTGEVYSGASVYCFLKNDDLTIWKAASWAAPAKNKSRGHVSDFNDETNYLKGKIQWTGF